MKKKILILFILIILSIGIIFFDINLNNTTIKTIKSEKELLSIYNTGDKELSLLEKILTLPFSILRPVSYPKHYNTWGNIKNVDYIDEYETAKTSETKNYSKTNIQVDGVDEADIIKTDGNYIYSLSKNKVVITNAKNPANIKIVTTITNSYSSPIDLLLYKDKLIVINSTRTNNYYERKTSVYIYNIKNKEEPKLVKSFEIDGSYYTTRLINGKLTVFSTGYLEKENNKIKREYIEDNKTKEIKLNHIKYIENNKNKNQTTIVELDLNNIKDITLNTYLIDLNEAYISNNNIYILKDNYEYNNIKIIDLFSWKGVIGFFKSMDLSYKEETEIYKFNINKNKEITFQTKKRLEGRIVNRYSLDEKDNNLRIALETEDGTRISILDKNLNLIGETKKVASGETMYATRFIGDKAYLVTYLNTDPLFVIDLKNPEKPRVMGELEIPGYSTYLHPYDENHLIGIGMDSEEIVERADDGEVISSWAKITGMKMCLFDVTDIKNPKEIAKTKIGDSRTVSAILTNPKALLFSKEKNLLAIPVNNYNEDFYVEGDFDIESDIDSYSNYKKNYNSEGYFVYNINLEDGFKLRGIINHPKEKNNNYYDNYSNLLRGLYIDNNLYTISEDYIKVNDLENLKELESININKEISSIKINKEGETYGNEKK